MAQYSIEIAKVDDAFQSLKGFQRFCGVSRVDRVV